MILHLLNIFFIVFHTVFTLFNVVGWAFSKTRKLHFITMLLTAASWFILGIWYGWGYCACTDWHWQIRASLGLHDKTNSYIQFLLQEITGYTLNQQLIETSTLVIFIVCFLLSCWYNFHNYRRQHT